MKLETLGNSLMMHFLTAGLGAAGQFVYFDEAIKGKGGSDGTFILAVHTRGAEKTLELATKAWDEMPAIFKDQLRELNIGFAVKQI